MKKFKAKKVKRKRRYIIFIFTFFFIFSYVFTYKYIETKRLNKSILNHDINYINFNYKEYINKKIKSIINRPENMLNYNVKRSKKNYVYNKNIKTVVNIKEDNTVSKSKDPFIYIYNTHDTESYNGLDVKQAALILTNKLNSENYFTILEEKSVKVFLDNNNLKYYKSYNASRTYMNDALNNNPSLKYFFDIHRDSVNKEKSTYSYNDKAYAKVMFIVGLDNPSSEKNLNNTKRLNNIINNLIPGISRGVITKGGKGVNGIYNQDLSENVFLIEIGGVENTKEEVLNTVDVLYKAIIEYVNEVI